jgi:hypothetical protein
MRRLVILGCAIAGVLSAGVPSGWTEAVPDKPGEVPPPCTVGVRPRISATISSVVFRNSQTLVIISAGRMAGVGDGWIGHVLRGDSDVSLPGGEIQIVSVAKTVSLGKVHLTQDQLDANPRVELTPP